MSETAARRQPVERLLNVLTVTAVAIFVASVTGYLHREVVGVDGGVKPGSRLSIPDVTLTGGKKAIIVAIQAECPYCEQSMAFYRDLAASGAGGAFEIVVVVPHSAFAGREILTAADVRIANVVRADFNRLRIAATPTMILVDEQQIVRNVWMGKLSPRTEELVFQKLGAARRAGGNADAEAARVREIVAALGAGAVVVDTRSRADYKTAAIEGALNIPHRELSVRMQHEVPGAVSVTLYCDYQASCPIVFENAEAETVCERAAKTAKRLGFADVRMIAESLDTLKAAGVRISHASQ
jgi:rhodanese-related sulfurtransferase